MKHLISILIVVLLCATASAQTVKSLVYNSNSVVIGPTNNLVITNALVFQKDFVIGNSGGAGQVQLKFDADTGSLKFYNTIEANNILVLKGDTDPVELGPTWNDATVRSSLGLPWSGLTNTNASDFQGALFSATNSAPANTTNAAGWVDLKVGTNSYKLPVYQ